MEIKEQIKQGYVLEVGASDQCRFLPYNELTDLGYIRLGKDWKNVKGDGLDDAPFDNSPISYQGDIHSGELIELEKGDYVIIIKKSTKRDENH